ncbi:MAG: DUF86 domain-containing protein [Micropruina sp.]|uniref:HepT-like ribonuclease domain-containing protein n=1 Tax=Micropruina sp. TaxID=2737536 RepID=UPI0039E4EAF6
MIDAAEQAQQLATGHDVEAIQADRQRRDALLWNFTVLGEAAAQLSDEFKAEHPGVKWGRPSQLRNRIVHGYWWRRPQQAHRKSTAGVRLAAGLSSGQLLPVQIGAAR